MIVFLAVVVGFFQPTCEIIVQVFGLLDAQDVNDAWIFSLGFLDAAMLQAVAQDEHDIEPVFADCDGRKNCSDFEKHTGLRRSNHDLAGSLNQVSKPLVQLDDLQRLAIEKLAYRKLATRMCLIAIGELATATWAGPLRFRFSTCWLPFPHGVSDSTFSLQLL